MKSPHLTILYCLRIVIPAILFLAGGWGCSGGPGSQAAETGNLSGTGAPLASAPTRSPGSPTVSAPTETAHPQDHAPLPSSNTATNPAAEKPAAIAGAVTPLDVVGEMIAQARLDRALADINPLTGETPICIAADCDTISNRVTGGDGLQRAKAYVFDSLASMGYSVQLEDWSRSGFTDQNIIAIKPGERHPEEKIYFVAHLDGQGSVIPIHYPAADDNASGVVDILETARVLSDYTFSRTIVFFISTGEEQGTLGVKSHLDRLSPSELNAIQYAVNIDMVGYDANQDHAMELWYGSHAPSLELAETISAVIAAYQLDLSPEFVVGCG